MRSLITFLCIFVLMFRNASRYVSSPPTFTHHHGSRHQPSMSQFLETRVHSLLPRKLCGLPKERKKERQKEGRFGKALVPILIQSQLSSFLCFHSSWDLRCFYSSLWIVCLCCVMCLCLSHLGSGSESL